MWITICILAFVLGAYIHNETSNKRLGKRMEQKTKTEKEKYQEMREMFYKEIMRMAKMLMKQEEKMMKEIAGKKESKWQQKKKY